MEQLLQNILQNAVKYAKPSVPPEVTVTSKETPTTWEFQVSDNGVGIPLEYQQEIFHPFRRFSEDRADSTGMPVMNGQKTLAEIRSDPELRSLPVVVMTSSEREEDIAKSYDLLANCYVRKPIDLNEFMKIVGAIESFWFGVVTLPAKEPGRALFPRPRAAERTRSEPRQEPRVSGRVHPEVSHGGCSFPIWVTETTNS